MICMISQSTFQILVIIALAHSCPQKLTCIRLFLKDFVKVLKICLELCNTQKVQLVFTFVQEGFLTTIMGKEDTQDEEIVQGSSEDEFLRIRLLSNDIRQSPIEDVHILTEDDQEGM